MARGSGLVIVAAVVLLAGCAAPVPKPAESSGDYPGDFALVFVVEPGPVVAPVDDPMRQPAVYLVEPDRALRVGLGPAASPLVHPPVSARLTPREMAGLWGLVDRGGLITPPDGSASEPPVWYHLELTAEGETVRYITDPITSPGARRVLRRLVELSGQRGGRRVPVAP